MTADRAWDLREFTRAVLKRVGVAGLGLPVVNDRGEAQVVTAVQYETVPALVRRLRPAGGYANVFVAMPDGVTAVSVLQRESALRADSFTPVSIPEDAATSVGMFVDCLTKQNVGSTCRFWTAGLQSLRRLRGWSWPSPKTSPSPPRRGVESSSRDGTLVQRHQDAAA